MTQTRAKYKRNVSSEIRIFNRLKANQVPHAIRDYCVTSIREANWLGSIAIYVALVWATDHPDRQVHADKETGKIVRDSYIDGIYQEQLAQAADHYHGTVIE